MMFRYPPYEAQYHETFPAFLESLKARFGRGNALTAYSRRGEPATLTYDEFYDAVRRRADELAARGLDGRHVAIVGENSIDWVVLFFACELRGAVAVCIDIEQPDDTIRQMIRRADAAAAYCAAVYRPIAAPLEAEGVAIYPLRPDGASYPPAPEVSVAPDTTAAIFYTSGTTDAAKPVMHAQRALLYNAASAITLIHADQRVFTGLPLFHTYGLTCAILGNMVHGAELIINGDLKTMLRDMKLANAASMAVVPLMLETMHRQIMAAADASGRGKTVRRLLTLNHALMRLGLGRPIAPLVRAKEEALGAFHFAVCGGAHIAPEILEDLYAFGILILQGYGITECAPLVSVNRNRRFRTDSVGFVLPDTEVKLVDGEIWVRGVSVMQGYYRDEALTAEAMEDGWFKTGDLGRMDRRGHLYITGRRKNLIVFKNGKKISPEKIELILGEIPLVRDVVVYGATNGSAADDVKLAASIYPDPALSAGISSYELLEQLQEEIDRVNSTLPTYQQIQMLTVREREFDKTSSRKIKRHLV